jgi:mRNA interferase MazF
VPAALSGLKRDSVVNVTQLFTLDLELLTDYKGSLPPRVMKAIGDGLRLVLSL